MTLPARIRGGLWGMGDNVMQLPLVRRLAEDFPTVHLATPWPQMYWHIPNVRFTHPLVESCEGHQFLYEWTHFRENIESLPAETWSPLPVESQDFWWWSGGNVRNGDNNRLRAVCPAVELGDSLSTAFALRDEWRHAAEKWLKIHAPRRPAIFFHVPTTKPGQKQHRNPTPDVFRAIHRECEGFSLFGASRIEPGICEPIAALDIPVFRSFGPDVTTLWALVALADAVITAPCHIMDLAVAFRRPTLLVIGGDLPAKRLFDPRQDLSQLVAIEPEPFCPLCEVGDTAHDCAVQFPLERAVDGLRRVLAMIG